MKENKKRVFRKICGIMFLIVGIIFLSAFIIELINGNAFNILSMNDCIANIVMAVLFEIAYLVLGVIGTCLGVLLLLNQKNIRMIEILAIVFLVFFAISRNISFVQSANYEREWGAVVDIVDNSKEADVKNNIIVLKDDADSSTTQEWVKANRETGSLILMRMLLSTFIVILVSIAIINMLPEK